MELEVSNIQKFYRGSDGEPDFALDLPTMKFLLGQTIFVMGHNGSGKSVLIKLLAGEISPSNDYVEVKLGQKRWRTYEASSAIVRQEAAKNLALDLTVRENLLLRVKPKSLFEHLFPVFYFDKYVRELVGCHTELSRKLDQTCSNLSGGQKQTLAFLVVASQNFSMLFLDEFLSATDQNASLLLRRLAKDYAERVPACVLVVSHDVKMALTDADRILVLRAGRLIQDIDKTSSDWHENFISSLL